MFTHTCTACARRQLVFPSQITSMTNTEAGILVVFDCWCGAEQAWLTGRAADTTRRTPVAA
jgi:hypothetical protein